jgi:putative ATP-dependent endonuclease of OLD family
MHISEVEIANYRSIGMVRFQLPMLCAFVGPNNAGKSNILRAIDFVLGPRWPTEHSLGPDDYPNGDTSRVPRIRLTLVGGEAGREIRYQVEFGPYGDDGEPKLTYRTPTMQRERFVSRELRDRFPVVRLDVERAVRRQQPSNRWTLLGRLLAQVNQALRDDEARMTDFTETMHRLRDDVLTSVPEFETLVGTIRTQTARQLQRTIEEIDVEFSLYDPWNFYRSLQLVVREYGTTIGADQAGMGLQSSLAIAILRAYAQIARGNRAIIAIEEPELFLHPLSQRQFYRLLRELSYPANGSDPLQILYTTHSDSFVEIEHFDEICIVRREPDDDGTWTTKVAQGTYRELVASVRSSGYEATEATTRARLQALPAGASDALFATTAVVVEGRSEAESLPVYARALGFDLDAENVGVIAAAGKGSIPTIVRLFQALRTPVYVVFDGDAHLSPEERLPRLNRQILELLGETPADEPETTFGRECTVWREDYERELRDSTPRYVELEHAAGELMGGPGKGPRARYCAEQLARAGAVPRPVQTLVERIRSLHATTRQRVPEAGRDQAIPTADVRDDWPDEVPF